MEEFNFIELFIQLKKAGFKRIHLNNKQKNQFKNFFEGKYSFKRIKGVRFMGIEIY